MLGFLSRYDEVLVLLHVRYVLVLGSRRLEVPVPRLDAASEAQPDDGDGAEHASEVERATVPLQDRRQTGRDALQKHTGEPTWRS